MALLETVKVIKRFGGLVAVNKMDFCIDKGEIVSIIGPNGAGKTTFFNTLTGIYHPEEGIITFNGKSLLGLRPDQIAERGIARTFQNIRLFGNLSVIENVLVGMHIHLRQSPVQILTQLPAFKNEELAAEKKAEELMHYVGLKGVGNELAKNLPYGAQRRVEIARALASDPLLLLLDEPTAGMNPQETGDAIKLFRRIRDEKGVTVLLIEHDMRVVMNISERISVMDYGEKIAEGTPAQIRSNQRVIEAYLGRTAVARPPAGGARMSLLCLENVHSYYGRIHALQGISLSVEEGEIVTLIGANGAGKSTTLRTISGLIHPKQGKVVLKDHDISHMDPHLIVEAGVGHVPEGRGIFPTLTVKENLEMGAFTINDGAEIDRRMEYGLGLFPRFRDRINQKGGTLSGGEQQMLAMARGLMLNPHILMLDEPSMGLSPILVESVFDTIKQMNAKGMTILLVEQNALMALSIANHGYVLQTGQIVLSDTAENLRNNEMVQKAYLGIE